MPETKIDDGGPAFPLVVKRYVGDTFNDVKLMDVEKEGMPLRDYLAAKAMAALFQGCGGYYKERSGFGDMMKRLAVDAYRVADLMISEKRVSK